MDRPAKRPSKKSKGNPGHKSPAAPSSQNPEEHNPRTTELPLVSHSSGGKVKKFSSPKTLLILLLTFYGLGLWFFSPYQQPAPFLTLAPVKSQYFHDEFVEWTLQAESPDLLSSLEKSKPWTWVEKDGHAVKTVGEMERVPLSFDEKEGRWLGRWPVPWNAPDGTYTIRINTTTLPASLPEVRSQSFQIVSRPFDPLPAGFGVLTLEGLMNLRRIPGPDGIAKDTSLVDWAEFIGADALHIQGGESSGYTSKPKDEFPWHLQSEKDIRALGRECHRRGIKLGVYVLCYLVGGPPKYAPNYSYGWYYKNGRMINGLEMEKRRGVSILEPKRPKDIVNALKRFQDMEEVDFIGLDYIRPAFGSYELVDDFVRDMAPEIPSNWKSLSFKERMLWLAKHAHLAPNEEMRSLPKYKITEQWFWYRAHRTAQVVRAIKNDLGSQKPLWAFTLSWQKGWEHGQDPVMMRDAGLDADAIMLYEADKEQFRGLVKQWNEYVRQDQVNLVLGDAIDWVLHQRTYNPAGPEDFYNRNMMAAQGFHSDKPARAIFIHDLHRARKGRIAPYSTEEWLLNGGAAITRLRQLHGRLPYELAWSSPESIRPGEAQNVTVSFKDQPPSKPVAVRLFVPPDVEVSPREAELSATKPSVSFRLRWTPTEKSALRRNRLFAALRSHRPENPVERCQIHIKYFQGTSKAAEPAADSPPSEK